MNENKSQEKILFPMKSIREELGLSQRELAIALGISEMTISRAERGVNEPVFTIKQTKILCKLLGKQIDELPEYLGKDFLEDGIPND